MELNIARNNNNTMRLTKTIIPDKKISPQSGVYVDNDGMKPGSMRMGEEERPIRGVHNSRTSTGAISAWIALANRNGPYLMGVLLRTLIICAWTDNPPQERTKAAAATL